MNLSESCCNTVPIISNYQAQGQYGQLSDYKVYRFGPKDSSFTLIGIYDICGFQPNTLQFLDKIAENLNIQLLVPDFFRQNAWPVEDFPVSDKAKFQNWIQTDCSYEIIGKDLKNIIQHFGLNNNDKKVGVIGFCWGGLMVTKALSDTELPIVAGAMCHPAFLQQQEFANILKPVFALPSKDEPDMLPFFDSLNANIKNISQHERFDNMKHGWCACRGDLNDESVKRDYIKANQLIIEFFKKFI